MAGGALRVVDLARSAQRWWASVLCAGFDSAVNDRVNRIRWPNGPLRYDLALLAELARLRTVPMMTLEMDDTVVEQEMTLAAGGNTSTYGGGFPICPDADAHDGLLDVTVAGPISRGRLIRIAPTLRRGSM